MTKQILCDINVTQGICLNGDKMKKYISEKISDNKNGLYLCQLPTAYGKSYGAMHAIADFIRNDKSDRKIIYITTLKKNLPFETLKNILDDDELYDKNVLIIPSNLDAVMDKLIETEIPDEFKTSIYHDLCSKISRLNSLKSYHDKEYIDDLKDRAGKIELAFRKEIYSKLKNDIPNIEQRINSVQKNEKYKWLGQVYPSVNTRNRKVLFMTVRKFLGENSTLVEQSYRFLDSNILDNAVVLIDEFDSVKNVISDYLIEKSLKINNEYFSMFTQIINGLQPDSMSGFLRKSIKNTGEKKYVELKEKGEKICSDYHLDLSYKVSRSCMSTHRNFLFHDGLIHTMFQKGKNYIRMVKNNDANRVEIFFESKEDYFKNRRKDDIPVFTMLRELNQFIRNFRNFLYSWASEYRKQENSTRTETQDEYTLDAALKTILSTFHMSDEQIALLTGETCMYISDNSSDILKNQEVYARGLELFEFEDFDHHNEETYLSYVRIYDSAEKVLRALAEKATVVGISATAEARTVIGNFNLDYLRTKLGSSLYMTDKALLARVKSEMEKYWNKYEEGNVRVNFQLLSDSRDLYSLTAEISKFMRNSEIAGYAADSIIQYTTDEYYINRYRKILNVMCEFWHHENINSMLCLEMKLPSESDDYMNESLLKELFEYACDDNDKEFDSDTFVILRSTDFDQSKEKLLKNLSDGKKRFVLSTYSTIGAGQNLQYKINDKTGLVCLSDNPDEKDLRYSYKDFDALYLSDITNITVNILEQIDKKALFLLLMQIEELYYNGEISYNIKDKLIRSAFDSHTSEYPEFRKDIYRTSSFRIKATQLVIQAVGRMCRTFIKNPDIHIYMDEVLLSKLDLSELKRRIIPPEMKIICRKCEELGAEYDNSQIELLNQAERKSTAGLWRIRQILSSGWYEYSMKLWERLREIVMKYPTASEENYNDYSEIAELYISSGKDQNSYLYVQQYDFQNVAVDFDNNEVAFRSSDRVKHILDNTDGVVVSQMSEQMSGLPVVLRYPGMEEYFKSNGFALEFKPQKWMMSPVLFNNIYKGALGEYAGKFILEHERGIRLQPITEPDKFEFFDFVMKPGVYVDFKNWKFSYHQDLDETRNEILRKLDAIGGERVYIINLVHRQGSKCAQSHDGRIIEIPGLLNEDGSLVPGVLNFIRNEDYE